VVFLHEQVSNGVAEKLRSTKDGLSKLQDETINASKVLVVSLDNLLSFINFSSYYTELIWIFGSFMLVVCRTYSIILSPSLQVKLSEKSQLLMAKNMNVMVWKIILNNASLSVGLILAALSSSVLFLLEKSVSWAGAHERRLETELTCRRIFKLLLRNFTWGF